MRGDRPYRKRLSLRIGGGNEINKQWGSWLRALPRPGRLKMIEETKEFFKCSKKLSFDSPVMEGDHTHCIGHKSTSMEGGGPIITGVEPKNASDTLVSARSNRLYNLLSHLLLLSNLW